MVGHFPRVSYVCLSSVSRWRENDEGDNGMGDTWGSATDFLEFALRLRKTPENLSQETVAGDT